MRLNHRFPFIPLARAVSMRSDHTSRARARRSAAVSFIPLGARPAVWIQRAPIHAFTLPPSLPPALPGFATTMDALTPGAARAVARAGLSTYPMLPSGRSRSTHTPTHWSPVSGPHVSGSPLSQQPPPFARRLARCTRRIEFTFVRAPLLRRPQLPPRLAATQSLFSCTTVSASAAIITLTFRVHGFIDARARATSPALHSAETKKGCI